MSILLGVIQRNYITIVLQEVYADDVDFVRNKITLDDESHHLAVYRKQSKSLSNPSRQ